MTRGITCQTPFLLSAPFQAWVAENGLERISTLVALDESHTRWTATEYVYDANDKAVLTADKSEVVTTSRTITTTPAQPEWLSTIDDGVA